MAEERIPLSREERTALWTLRILVERGVIEASPPPEPYRQELEAQYGAAFLGGLLGVEPSDRAARLRLDWLVRRGHLTEHDRWPANELREVWSREKDTAYREAVEESRPKPEDREVVLADFRVEVEAATKRALERLDKASRS